MLVLLFSNIVVVSWSQFSFTPGPKAPPVCNQCSPLLGHRQTGVSEDNVATRQQHSVQSTLSFHLSPGVNTLDFGWMCILQEQMDSQCHGSGGPRRPCQLVLPAAPLQPAAPAGQSRAGVSPLSGNSGQHQSRSCFTSCNESCLLCEHKHTVLCNQ